MSTNKPWDKPWSMEEIIDNSDKWSLAGDVALLNTLKSFAGNLIARTTDINNTLQNLTNNLDETSLQLNIAQNEFQSLRNSQFIESRVYEDDETLPQTDNNEKVDEQVEPDRTEDIKLAALKGLQVLDQYFEKIEVSVSDSEDDDIDLPNYVLRPKDLYIDRPLPYVIGSEEWHKSWHVGLEDSSSDSETEKVSDKFSESDSESDLPIIQDRSQIKGTSDTSSELDFSQRTEASKQVHSKQDLFHSSDSEDQHSIPGQLPISNKNFAEQLAAKLGNVIKEDLVEPEVNRRPIQPKSQYGDLFFDEPPPLDESEGLFSGGTGLFDDDDDDDAQYSTPAEPKAPETLKPTGKSGPGLFDADSSDDDIFSTNKPKLLSNKPPLFAEEPPALDEKKKPIGGVSIFGGANLFDKKLLKRQPSFDEAIEEQKIDDKAKKIDLFSDDIFTEDRPTDKTNSVPKKINLFDSDDEVGEPQNRQIESKEAKISLFDDDDLFRDDLFSTTTTKKKFTSGLFDDVDDQLFSDRPKIDDLMSIPDNKNSINVNSKVETKESESPAKAPEEVAPKPESPKAKPRISLFDSPPPEPDDLFGDVNFEPSHSNIFGDDLFGDGPKKFGASTPEKAAPEPVKVTPSMRLFDPSPPPDDDWAKSDDELEPYQDQDITEAPPSLDLNLKADTNTAPHVEEPKPVQSPGKLKHNLNINVAALMPGSLPPKRADLLRTVSAESAEFEVDNKKSFDTTDNVEVLHSVTKDRARVPFHRRPSTRRGRKAALKTSGTDFKLDQDQEDAPSSRTEGLFDSLKSEVKPKSDLFGDDDEEEDMFSSKKAPAKIAKKSLFDDDEDDDIFKSFSSGNVAKKPETKVATEKKIPKVSAVKKLENTKPDDDPLSALLK